MQGRNLGQLLVPLVVLPRGMLPGVVAAVAEGAAVDAGAAVAAVPEGGGGGGGGDRGGRGWRRWRRWPRRWRLTKVPYAVRPAQLSVRRLLLPPAHGSPRGRQSEFGVCRRVCAWVWVWVGGRVLVLPHCPEAHAAPR